MDLQLGTVKTEAFSMDYCRFGNGKCTFIILPGLSAQSVMPQAKAIAQQYRALTDDFTVYVLDRRKGRLPSVYTIQDMAGDTMAAMDALGIEKADIFGASQGGMIAMEIAIGRPDLVHSLIIGSSSAVVSDEQFVVFDEWIHLAKSDSAAELYLEFGEKVCPAEVFEAAKDALKEASKTVTDEELIRFVIMAEGIRGFDITENLEKISCPVLVIGSEDDRVVGGDASRRIAEGLTNAECELYMYDGYGHAAYDCAPDYQERMRSFLKGQHEVLSN